MNPDYIEIPTWPEYNNQNQGLPQRMNLPDSDDPMQSQQAASRIGGGD